MSKSVHRILKNSGLSNENLIALERLKDDLVLFFDAMMEKTKTKVEKAPKLLKKLKK